MDVNTKLLRLRADAEKRFIPILRADGAAFLTETVKACNPSKILEIGTAIGYSGILMLANCHAKLTTVEIDPDRLDEAVENFADAGLTSRAEFLQGDAAEVLSLMEKRFDFCFLDAAKGQYRTYFGFIDPMLEVGGTLVADNVGYHGLVDADGKVLHKHRTIVANMREFLSYIQSRADYATAVYPEVGDGMLVMKKLCPSGACDAPNGDG